MNRRTRICGRVPKHGESDEKAAWDHISSTSPKTNMDAKKDGLEKVTPLKYGHFWYLC